MGMGRVACADDTTSGDCKFPPIAYTALTQIEDATVCAVPELLTKRRSFLGEPCLEATERDVGRRFFFF